MRTLADPIRREQMLTLYRQGCNHTDVAKAMGVAFKPVMQKAIELALKADEEGEMEGSHKALGHVIRFYEKNLDREHAEALLERKGEIAREIEGNRPPPTPVLGSPAQIAALVSGIEEKGRQEALKDQAIEVEEVE